MTKATVNVVLSDDAVRSSTIRANWYIDQACQHVETLDNYLTAIQRKGESLAIYVPGRAVNALSIANTALDSIRFIDDNPMLVGTYFPGCNVPAESREMLIAKPTDNVIIMSRTFGVKLALELKQELKGQVNIVTIDDVLSLTKDITQV